MSKVVTFGEIMLRLSTPRNQRFIQAESFDVTYGGAEANVAVSLANYGLDAYLVTKLPDNPIGQAALNHLRRYGVHTDYILRGGSRLGIYFLESGMAQRPSKIVYDRLPSALSESLPSEFKWQDILTGAAWFHFTGITPALSTNTSEAAVAACKAAKDHGAIVSCDLNYRKNLWSPERANQVMTEAMKYVDVLIANEEDAEKVFGIKASSSDVSSGKLNEAGYQEVARQLADRFNLSYVAITLRESISASHNGWSGLLLHQGSFYRSPRYDIIPIVDRVGGGDSFGGALIYALLVGKAPQEALNFAVAASCLKHTIPGDFNLMGTEEVELLARGDASGRVQR